MKFLSHLFLRIRRYSQFDFGAKAFAFYWFVLFIIFSELSVCVSCNFLIISVNISLYLNVAFHSLDRARSFVFLHLFFTLPFAFSISDKCWFFLFARWIYWNADSRHHLIYFASTLKTTFNFFSSTFVIYNINFHVKVFLSNYLHTINIWTVFRSFVRSFVRSLSVADAVLCFAGLILPKCKSIDYFGMYVFELNTMELGNGKMGYVRSYYVYIRIMRL